MSNDASTQATTQETAPQATGTQAQKPTPAPATPAPPAGPYRAICFDLDGTLLPLDLDEFMQRYFAALEQATSERGIGQDEYMDGLNAGIRAMATHDDGRPNDEVFWENFAAGVDDPLCDWTKLFGEFYGTSFDAIGADVKANPAAARAINTLLDKGYPLILTTMPMFPLEAVTWRLAWAGVDPDAFKRITTFDNSTACKPQAIYYAENLAAMGAAGSDVLMVGNNTVEDLSFGRLGADVFLVTDFLLNPDNLDVDTVRHGTLEQFADWAETLPPCENPVGTVEKGLVDHEVTEEVLIVNERAVLAAEKAAEA